jgi:O-antigen ligase
LVGIPNGNPRNTMRVWWDGPAGAPRAFGFLADANHYAGYLVSVILLALALIIWNRRSIFPYVVLAASSAGLMFSLSRSGMVTLVLVGIPALLFLLRRARFPIFFLRPMLKIGIALMILRAFIGPIIDRYPEINSLDPWRILTTRLQNLSDNDVTVQSHFRTRMAALDAFVGHPVIGIGLATIWYSENYKEYFGGSHSHHLDALGHTGLIGAGLEWAFMGLVGLYMWRGLKYSPPNSEERAVMVGLLAAFISIMIGNFLYHYYLNDFVWFLMGCGVALSHNIKQDAYFRIAAERQSVA